MKEKMTSGEIAKQAGVSAKALRVYDEKGLLKPVGYSEGNYKLYDKSSLMILEKIIALKHVGFSLEEIKSSLENDEQESIEATLRKQLQLMEDRIYQLQKSAGCIKAALARIDENPDWDDVADIIRKMEFSQGQDERRWYAASHAADGIEWYVKIYDSLNFEEGDRVLDLGCSFGLLWRENWDRIPVNFQVDGYDIHGNWADDLYEYLKGNRSTLPKDSDIQVIFSNLELDETWDRIREKRYTKAVAHYLLNYIEGREKFVRNVSKSLVSGGLFSVNTYGISKMDSFWEKMIADMGLDNSFVIARRDELKANEDAFKEELSGYFKRVDLVALPCPIIYDDAELLFQRLTKRYAGGIRYIEQNKEKILAFLDKKIQEEGSIVMDNDSGFFHCYK
ncbi:MerR family transcriptional regulator [Butyrivibrio sp. DSM 10294]|uniref:MerR family transcriptional regulator n=1 Tax=Butyrivibrio sp. DSM 10294 TaxID=2972457 RepID=UPI00234E3CAD|nr:MerR family transcriptional regulator [Butyrivibrio sp. DSM 10294]MDC7294506.1 MerR family transcriptional regulator [Butyrivibrio sp. DSM 10294]